MAHSFATRSASLLASCNGRKQLCRTTAAKLPGVRVRRKFKPRPLCFLDDATFEAQPKIDDAVARALAIWFELDTELFEVQLFIDGSVAKYFERKPLAPTQRIEGKDADGSLEVVVTITHEMEIVPTIKQWLPYLRVLEPKWLEEMIEKDIKDYLA